MREYLKLLRFNAKSRIIGNGIMPKAVEREEWDNRKRNHA